MYSNCCCSCSSEPEIIKIDQSSHKIYRNNLLNFAESTTILNVGTKKSGNLLKAPRMFMRVCVRACVCLVRVSRVCVCVCVCVCVTVREYVSFPL